MRRWLPRDCWRMGKRVCGESGCDAPCLARGFCNKHYLRWRNAGGQTKPRPPLWAPEEDVVLLAAGLTPHTERYAGRSRLREAAHRLGRTRTACVSRLSRLMCARGHVPGKQWTEAGLWTAPEDRLIARIVEKHPERVPMGTWPDVARVLGRTVGAVQLRAWKLRHRLETGRSTSRSSSPAMCP